MNNEPVAWMYERPNGSAKLTFVREPMAETVVIETPLYTHPSQKPTMVLDGNRIYPAVKELTVEEIDKLAKIFGVVGLHEDAGLYEFVREILNNG